jgi:hypothetical protein
VKLPKEVPGFPAERVAVIPTEPWNPVIGFPLNSLDNPLDAHRLMDVNADWICDINVTLM